MTEERLLTVREVARLCDRSEETVRRWIWSGKLPARKLGNQLFIAEGEVGRLEQGQQISEAKAEYRARNREALSHSRDSLKQIEDDEAFQDEVRTKYGPVDVVELLKQVREE